MVLRLGSWRSTSVGTCASQPECRPALPRAEPCRQGRRRPEQVREAIGCALTLALGARVPTMSVFRQYVEAGGLMSYGPNATRRSCTSRHAARAREFGHAAGEIAQMQAQLIERKADRENAFQLFVRQLPHRTFTAQRREFGGIALEHGFGRLQGGWRLPRQQRGGA